MYHTMTPAEAKRLTKYMSLRLPARTASVLSKPRPPPIVISDLDDFSHELPSPNQLEPQLYSSQPRSSSACSNQSSFPKHRHSINLGQFNHRLSNQHNSATSTLPKSQNSHIQTSQSSPNDSGSNLSFRSSLNVVDSAYGSDKLQTTNAQSNQYSRHHPYSNCGALSPYTNLGQPQSDLSEKSQRFSDDSFTSAKSHQSDTSRVKSLSKSSLSSSTSKVFQNQLCNIKKFFRNMPTRRSIAQRNTQLKGSDKITSDTVAESVSQLCLNRSQSPPVCPPPPGELKSVSYLESSINYSNYDEFTRARNQKTSTLLRQATNGLPSRDLSVCYQKDASRRVAYSEQNDHDWQLTSLPVSYERNLATVFEEKNNLIDVTRRSIKGDHFISKNHNNNLELSDSEKSVNNKHLIKPPSNFDDTCFESTRLDTSFKSAAEFGSNHSLTSVVTADSVLDYRQTAASFRFSYANPNPPKQVFSANNSGLPPRMPVDSDGSEHFPCNGSPKSSCSSNIIDGIANSNSNNCDPKGVSASDTVDHYNSAIVDSKMITSSCFATDTETSILSDTSTLNGEYCQASTANRCTELERTVNILKNKLISKEKELTDLQLKQWSSDYLIEQLRTTINQLEKENAQLKMIANRNQTFNRANI